MAESKGGKRYGHGPKIANKEVAGEKVEHTTPEKGGDSGPSSSEASGTGGVPVKEQATEQPKGETSHAVDGAGAAPPAERHGKEMKEMHDRHGQEMSDMHVRHQTEYKKMMKRHMEEMAGGGAE